MSAVKPPFVIAVLFAAAIPLAGVAQPPRISNTDAATAVAQLEQTLVDVIARTEPSVVAISRTPPKRSLSTEPAFDATFSELRDIPSNTIAPLTVGAGVIIDRAGLVLTHYPAVREADQPT